MLFSSVLSKIGRICLIMLVGAAVAMGQAKVNIQPGMNIPSVVDTYPAGTTFVIYPGVYRLSRPIRAQTGDIFVGFSACAPPKTSCPAILNGSKLLTSFQRS